MTERMTWNEIKNKYPDRWVGLANVKYIDDDGISVESAMVKYTDKSKSELAMLALKGETIPRYTDPDSLFQVGLMEVVP